MLLFLIISNSFAATTSSGNLGIGTQNPEEYLVIRGGNAVISGSVTAGSFSGDGSALTGISGGSSGWTDGGTNVYTTATTDNVGIGTANPQSTLQALGDTKIGNGTFSNTSSNEDLYVEGNLEVDGSLFGSGTGPMTITNANVGIGTVTAGSLLTVGSTGQFTVDTSGNTRVGIGTTTAGTIVFVKSISSSTAVLGYCTGSLTNSICGTCN